MTKAQRQRQARERRDANRAGRIRNQANRMLRRFHLPELPDTPRPRYWMGFDPGFDPVVWGSGSGVIQAAPPCQSHSVFRQRP